MALLTVTEVAARLRIGRNAAYALVHRPDFPAIWLHAHAIRVQDTALDRWLAEQEQGSKR